MIHLNSISSEICSRCSAVCCKTSSPDSDSFSRVPYFESDREKNYEIPRMIQKDSCVECKFLENNRCSCYSSRPLICRTYPLFLDFWNNSTHQAAYTIGIAFRKECELGRYYIDNLGSPEVLQHIRETFQFFLHSLSVPERRDWIVKNSSNYRYKFILNPVLFL
jgi:Fe-S-cluster containining protein